MPRIYEKITKYKPRIGGTVRVWRQVTMMREAFDRTQDEDVRALCLSQEWAGFTNLVEAIADLPRVNAVEYLDAHDQNGLVVYNDWP